MHNETIHSFIIIVDCFAGHDKASKVRSTTATTKATPSSISKQQQTATVVRATQPKRLASPTPTKIISPKCLRPRNSHSNQSIIINHQELYILCAQLDFLVEALGPAPEAEAEAAARGGVSTAPCCTAATALFFFFLTI